MTAQLAPSLYYKDFNANGVQLSFGYVYSYVAGSTTPQATYTDSTQTVQNTNPIRLNSRGEANIWLDPTLVFRFVVMDATGSGGSPGNIIRTVDNVQGL